MNLLNRSRQYLAVNSALLLQNWPVWLVSLATFLNGSWSIVSILLTRVHGHGQYLLPFDEIHLSRTFTLVLGFILVYRQPAGYRCSYTIKRRIPKTFTYLFFG